ncbi:cyclophilin-like fold protein [Streptomyces flaveolus]|uniref:cyclophilin-like fold protein n=1 Tax=Streptomyces flaveolus TaxID=67297 RepID=UPI0038072D5C
MICPSRRGFARTAPAAALLLALAACSDGAPGTAMPSASSSAGRQETPVSEGNTSMDLRVTLDGRPVDATLNDSPAARDLVALLPLTIDLKDFHGTERIGYPPRRLDTGGAPEPTAAKAGDLAYYAPWGNLALFHRDGPSASADLLVLGHIDAGPEQLAGAGRITIEAAS